jgi:signal transduction histidine kinase
LNAHSFHARLIVGAALAILLALAVAGSGLVWLFERHIEHREALSMEAKAKELLPGLRIDATGRPIADTRPSDGRFWRPAGNLYWQASTPVGSIYSRSLWDQTLGSPGRFTGETWTLRRADGPFGHRLIIISRLIRPDATRRPIIVQFATDDDALVRSFREFRLETALALCLLWFVLVLATTLQVRLGLRPFRRVSAELDRLRRNPAERLSSDHPREIAPLVEAINALADARAIDLERARRRAADLAHSLKTPLAALAAQSRRARAEGATKAADALDRTIAVTQAALEAELARARSAITRESQTPKLANVAESVEGVVSVVERTDVGSTLVFDVDVETNLRAPLGPSDLAEILGALVENAARFARRRIAVQAYRRASSISIRISDDGPGMQSGRVSEAMVRGARLDETGPGHGLGLSIVADLVGATGGAMTFGEAELGGVLVALDWPFEPQPSATMLEERVP